MKNTLNYGITGGVLGFFINIFNQKNNKLFSKIDYKQAIDTAIKTGIIGAGLGGLKDIYYELDWEQSDSKEQKKYVFGKKPKQYHFLILIS
ncbi:MAG: hypothetical protein A2X61_05070 [Ignavibacteria bacterium GWB2_35_12]|nr:MAG: hypothetical protein A2X63_02805 [Ignavibacteria bacterium GWA2_35_8]OGU42319.1 MAG: hypothetical protein A2X61_05070 [Ignavibacteria bacterium GWB2_35_12]OGU96977.1 MAG: hypothetical protein A2220_10095 [Ignavibacteria bacterium RIFOXYA2_FULL_35_10]OGV18547.1 MAG: hypothetical protein A2475_01760 [Ignavibacteria bacterium RIFOXYC2_FULL_35_21]